MNDKLMPASNLPTSWQPFIKPAPLPPDELALVKRTVAQGATDDELRLFLFDCARQGVHPLDRLIHFTVRTNKHQERRYTPITSIDFMRQRAADTGDYAGSDDPTFGDLEQNKWPVSATVTVWRMVQGQRCPFTATARWAEYKPDQDAFMWLKMPHTMLGKCAEGLALRKGFPKQLAGLYAKEEMDQAGQGDQPKTPRPSLMSAKAELTDGQAEPAMADVSTGAPRSEGLPRSQPPENDRPTGDHPLATILQDVRDGRKPGSFQITTDAGEEFAVYKKELRSLAQDALSGALAVLLTRKQSAAGSTYVVDIQLAPGQSRDPGDEVPF
jgi:phage recombination protein Bet